ncbi:kynB [Nephila pilipes]|uniref:KynB n=1 Tax=Nephila pilipes TaxID=299642 RepID=A0A8X6TR04_NEPPI|nr:kynB [Nephila pilipes]
MVLHLLLLCSIASAAPVAKRMVDMTYTFDETTLNYPGMKKFDITTLVNGTTDQGFWLRYEEFSVGIHVGTHMDAPAHFSKNGITIHDIPVSRLIAPAAVIDITAKAELDPDAEATVEDLLRWESVTGQSLNETILLLRCGWGKKWGDQEAFFGTSDNDPNNLHFPGLAPDAARWMVENRNILGIGTETLSFDNGPSVNKDVHQILLGHGLFGIENIANMDKIPIYGATLYVMPMKIGDASGAPTRIVATFPEIMFDYSTVSTAKDTESCYTI